MDSYTLMYIYHTNEYNPRRGVMSVTQKHYPPERIVGAVAQPLPAQRAPFGGSSRVVGSGELVSPSNPTSEEAAARD